MKARLATALLVAAATACGSVEAGVQPVDPDAQICQTEGRGAVATYSQALILAAALPTTAAAVAQWEFTRFGANGPRPVVSRWSNLPANHRVVFCYFDGDFANYFPPGPPRPLIHERALVLATEGRGATLDHIGSKATTPLTAP